MPIPTEKAVLPEEHGSILTSKVDSKFLLADINYGNTLGSLALESGPGWIFLPNAGLSFLDGSQMILISELIFMLNSPS